MKYNDDKCHLIVCNQDNVCVTLEKETNKNSNSVELLGIKIDAKLNFTEHVTDLCKKANQITCPSQNIELLKRR